MSVAILVFIVFSFYSLRPVARLGHEAVDEALELSESWGPNWAAHRLAGLLAADIRFIRTASLRPRECGILLATASVWFEIFMFICPYQTRTL
jgi:hypothetical protein